MNANDERTGELSKAENEFAEKRMPVDVSMPETGAGTPQQRRQYLGGSDVAAILGLSKWTTPLQLWEKKTGRFKEIITPEKQKLFDRGHRWEQPAFEMLCDELESRGHVFEVVARNKRYKDDEFPYLACEIDCELILDGEPVNVEIKTVHPFAAGEWGEGDTEEIPVYYAAQAMFGLMITGKRLTLVAALIGADNIVPYFVARDQETIDGMRKQSVAWWEKHIVGDVPPDPVNMSDMKRLMIKFNGRPVELDDDAFSALQKLDQARYTAKSANDAAEVLQFQVADMVRKAWALNPDSAIVDDAELLYHGQKVGSWKKQGHSHLDQKGLAEAHPELKKQFTITQTIRVMRIAKAKK